MPPTIGELREKYKALKGQAAGLRDKAKAEERELNADEVVQMTSWLDEGEGVVTEIKATEEAEAKAIADRNTQDNRFASFAAFGDTPQPRRTAPVNPSDAGDRSVSSDPKRRSKPNIVGGPDSSGFSSFGEMLRAVEHASHNPRVDPRLKYEDFGPAAAASGLNESTPSEGGFLVEQQTMAGLWERAYDTSALLSRIETVGIGPAFSGLKANGIDETSRADGSRFGGVRAYWAEEAGTVTASNPKFSQIALELKDLMAIYYTTGQLLQDTVALESLVSKAISSEMAFKVEDAIINGTGAGQPLGVINGGSLVNVAKETGQAAATLEYKNIVKMWSRMWARSRLTAVWLLNQDLEPELFTMTMPAGTGAVPVYIPPGGASASPYSTIFGRDAIPVEYCQTAGTKGDILLVDLSQYLGIEKGSLQQASSMHVRFIYNEMTYRFTFRFDGAPIWKSALTPKNGTNTVSPFVTLAARP